MVIWRVGTVCVGVIGRRETAYVRMYAYRACVQRSTGTVLLCYNKRRRENRLGTQLFSAVSPNQVFYNTKVIKINAYDADWLKTRAFEPSHRPTRSARSNAHLSLLTVTRDWSSTFVLEPLLLIGRRTLSNLARRSARTPRTS